MNLVEVKRKEIFCDSSIVARKFGQNHNKVTRLIEKLTSDLSKLRRTAGTDKLVVRQEEREYRGRRYKVYLMNRTFFSILAMRFKGQKALEWQLKFTLAFDEMEERLLQESMNKKSDSWIEQREQGKLIRKETTDILKKFVDYATEQGSTKAQFYYKHVTNATYKALGLMVQRKPKLRDTLNGLELAFVASAEHVAQQSIKKHMEDKIPYKKIYDFVKEDLEAFAKSLYIGKTIAKVK